MIIHDETKAPPPRPEPLPESNPPRPHRTPPSTKNPLPKSPLVSLSIKGASQRSVSGQGSSQGSIGPSSSQGSNAAPEKPQHRPPPLQSLPLPSKPAGVSITFRRDTGQREVLPTRGMSVFGASSLIRPAEVSVVPKMEEDEEEGEVVEEPVEAMKQSGNDVKEEQRDVWVEVKEERREARNDVKEDRIPTAPSSALTDLFPSSQPPSIPASQPTPVPASQSIGSDSSKRQERRRSRWEQDDSPVRKREEKKGTSHRYQDGKDSISYKPQDGNESNQVKESTRIKELTQVKWDETVEKAEAGRTSGEIRDETRHRSRSRGTAGDATSARSHSRSSSRHSPPPSAGSSRKDTFDLPVRTGTDTWKPSDTSPYSRPRPEHERSNRHYREDTTHNHDRRGLPYEYSKPVRRGLDYGATEEAEPVHRESRSHQDRHNSQRYDRPSNRPYRDGYQREGNREYANNGHPDDPERPLPPHLPGEPFDRRSGGSQEQRSKRRSPSYGEYAQRPATQEGQWNPASQEANTTSRHNPGWDNASLSQNEPGSALDNETPGWRRPYAGQRNYDREAEPRDDWNARRQHDWAASQDRGRHAYGNNYRGNGNYTASNDRPRGQSGEYRHLSPKRERPEVLVKDGPNPLKRSGSPLQPLKDPIEGEPATKKQRLEPDEVMRAAQTSNPQSTQGAVPFVPSDAPPGPPDGDAPPAPPLSPPPPPPADMGVASDGTNAPPQAGSPMQIETPDEPPVAHTPMQRAVEEVAAEAQSTVDLAPPPVYITVTPANNVATDVSGEERQNETSAPFSELAPLIPPAWSPVLPASPVISASQAGTVWRQTSPLMQSPVMPAGSTENTGEPSRAPTPNPNAGFSLLDLKTPFSNDDTLPSDRSTFMRRKGDKLDPADDLKAYNKKFVGIARLEEFIMPSGADKKEATLGKGTFGVVTKAVKKQGNQVVALKLLQPPEEAKGQGKAGVLGTTVREIKILKLLNHENIVPLLDIVVDRDQASDLKTFLVFPYMDHDLCGLLKNPGLEITDSLIKLYLLQLLEGVAYMHHNNIVHRDLKSANILLNNTGLLQIADFGLARAVPQDMLFGCDDDIFLTNMVVTRWYRAPELFMGETQYGFEVDMWSVGCILSEMWTRRVLFQGRSDPDQLKVIFDSCGTPDASYLRFDTVLQHKEVINDNQGADSRKVIPVTEIATPPRKRVLREDSRYHHAIKEFKDLLDKFLQLDPSKRITAAQALEDRYIWMAPGPLPRDEVKHLAASKERRDQQEEAEAKERTREVERVQNAHANIQAQMASSAAMGNMPPRVHMQPPPAQLPPHQFPPQATNPYAQPTNFYATQPPPMVNPPMPPHSMPYNSNVGPPPGVIVNPNPYVQQNVSAFPPVTMGRPPPDVWHDNIGMPPQSQSRPVNNFGGNRQHGMPSNGGIQAGPGPAGPTFTPKFKGNFHPGQARPPATSQEQTPRNPRPVNPNRFG